MTAPVETDRTVEPDEDGDDTGVYVSVSIIAGGENATASTCLVGEPSDDEVARALLRVAAAVAQVHGSGAWMALQRMTNMDGVTP